MRPSIVRRGRARPGIAFAALALAACAGKELPPPRLYVLNPVSAERAARPAPGAAPRVIVVAPTLVPEYLDRPQVIERTSSNELKLMDSDQWAERLSVDISRVLAQDLAILVPADAAPLVPARTGQPAEYQVQLDLDRFELDDAGAVVLVGRWSVSDASSGRELVGGPVSERQQVGQPGGPPPAVAAVVTAMNQGITAVGRTIAQAIQKLPPEGAAR